MAAIILAHANSSMNSVLYGVTNKQFRDGYKLLLRKITCGRLCGRVGDIDVTKTNQSSNNAGAGGVGGAVVTTERPQCDN